MKWIITPVFFLVFVHVSAQKKPKEELFYVFDSQWNPCAVDTATFISYIQKFDDTTWQWNNYHFWGSLVTIETYKDKNATIPNGYFAYFNRGGKIDSGGNVINARRNGTWYLYGDSLKPQVVKEYAMGRLINQRKIKPDPEDADGSGNEAEFKNGAKGWRKYLENTIQIPVRASGKNPGGTAVLGFVVSEAGKIESVYILKSVEMSFDKEAMRVVERSPAWIPGEKHGQKVKAYRIQPITFAL